MKAVTNLTLWRYSVQLLLFE